MRVLRRYVLLQIPDAALSALVLYGLYRWAGISVELASGLFVLWIVVHVAYYPFVKKAYEIRPSELVGPERMIGAPGVAMEEIDPVGYVRVESELWGAELCPGEPPIAKGSGVCVHAVRDLTLIVRSESPAKSC
jgi:membrane protein implicated in regulation of membrane protease activity